MALLLPDTYLIFHVDLVEFAWKEQLSLRASGDVNVLFKFVFCWDKYHGQKQSCEEWLSRLFHSPPLREGKIETRGKNLEVGTETETMAQYCFLACLHG